MKVFGAAMMLKCRALCIQALCGWQWELNCIHYSGWLHSVHGTDLYAIELVICVGVYTAG
jgi:hypothetical protein